MLKYWSSAFMTTGAAIVATAVFSKHVVVGLLIGIMGIFIGAWFHGLSLPVTKDKKR